ncbi:hypothetical protein [Phaeobacter sp.]|uniref:hypothetical protein n=1 Tax=Phaeobacter sp. TaxID=1902409 RepID=UPI0025DC0915|nr:hypothetical protein [Phaeobacter sp.]
MAEIDTNPATWSILQLWIILLGVVGRLVLQPREGVVGRRIVQAILVLGGGRAGS